MVLAIPDENYGERGTVSDDPIIIAGQSDSAHAVPFDSAPPLIHSLFTPFSWEHGFSAIGGAHSAGNLLKLGVKR